MCSLSEQGKTLIVDVKQQGNQNMQSVKFFTMGHILAMTKHWKLNWSVHCFFFIIILKLYGQCHSNKPILYVLLFYHFTMVAINDNKNKRLASYIIKSKQSWNTSYILKTCKSFMSPNDNVCNIFIIFNTSWNVAFSEQQTLNVKDTIKLYFSEGGILSSC